MLLVNGGSSEIWNFFKYFNNSKNLRPSHGRSHGVTDVINQHQDVCPALEPLRQ